MLTEDQTAMLVEHATHYMKCAIEHDIDENEVIARIASIDIECIWSNIRYGLLIKTDYSNYNYLGLVVMLNDDNIDTNITEWGPEEIIPLRKVPNTALNTDDVEKFKNDILNIINSVTNATGVMIILSKDKWKL